MDEVHKILLGLNKEFFKGARSVWVNRHRTSSWWPLDRAPSRIDVDNFTVLRDVEGIDGSFLFVLDVDFATDRARAVEIGNQIEKRYPEEFNRKFSGSAGPHLIAQMSPGDLAGIDLRSYGNLTYFLESVQIGILEGSGFKVFERGDIRDLEQEDLVCVNPHVRSNIAKHKGKVLPLVDRTLFQRRRRFRGFCCHHSTGAYSVPYEQGESWDEVSERASLGVPPIKEFFLPRFTLYEENVGPVRPKPMLEGFAPEPRDVNAEYLMKADEVLDFTFCPGIATDLVTHLLGKGDGHHGPSHFVRYMTAAFCRYLGWSPDMVFRLFERLNLPDFDHTRTAYYIRYEWRRDFYRIFYMPTHVSCGLIKREGFCVGDRCPLYTEESYEDVGVEPDFEETDERVGVYL